MRSRLMKKYAPHSKNSMKRTIEVLSDKELMEQLRESKKDKEAGRIRPYNELAKELGI